ncbi:hypothetical protein Tco_1370685 [Tanacetum coccineum]
MDVELLDLHDRCYARQVVVDNAVNRRSHELLLNVRLNVTSLEAEKARLEAVKVSLQKEVEELKQDRREVVSKVSPYAAMELIYSDDMGNLVGRLVSSTLLYRRCRAYEQRPGQRFYHRYFPLVVKFVAELPLQSSTPVSNPMSPLIDAFVAKPQSSPLQ